MIRRLMASSAMAALLAAGAFSLAQAQTEQPAAGAEQPAAGADQGEQLQTQPAQPTLTPQEPTIATAFMGQSVYSSQDPQSDNIGEVNDLIIGPDGKITHAVVGVGGFLGIGEKNVAVPFDQLQVAQNEGGEIRLIYAATREQLEAAEAFDRTAFDPEERAQEQQAAATDAAGGAATDAGAGGVTPVAPTPAEQTAAGADTGAGNTDQNNAAADAQANQPAQQQTAAAPAQPAPGGPPPEGFMAFDPNQVRASTMIGQELYGPNNESIGEISDLILQEDGKTRAALIDVGGFLGIGEKRVSIPFDQIKVAPPQPAPADMTAQPAATDPAAQGGQPAAGDPAAQGQTAQTDPAAQAGPTAGTEPVLTVALTREQIEQLPEYQDPEEQAQQQAAADPNAAGGTAGTAPPAAGADPNAPAGTAGVAAGTDPNAAAGQQQAAADAQNQYQPVTQELSADNLMGSAVYSQNEENLGEVGDVVFDPQGSIQAVVVDVGGFLGIGEKSVAIQYDALNVQKNGNGDIRIMVNATQEQLQNAPSYTADATAAAGQGQQPAPQ